MAKEKFLPGRIVATPGALETLSASGEVRSCVLRETKVEAGFHAILCPQDVA